MNKISIICSSQQHPIYPRLQQWIQQNQHCYDVELVACADELRASGDFLFLISCGELIPATIRRRFCHTLVLHASDLPEGRGWSPHIWQIIAGADYITLSLLEAEDELDSGRIWCKKKIPLASHELYDEINNKLFTAEIELMDKAIKHHATIEPQPQQSLSTTEHSIRPSYYRLRTPEDSRLDVTVPLASQFNLLRVCDPQRFPAFFEYNGARYAVKIEKIALLEDE